MTLPTRRSGPRQNRRGCWAGIIQATNSYIYILKFTKSGRYYIGSTTDITRRLEQHRSEHTESTKRLGHNFKLVFSQCLESLAQARRIEAKIKSWKRRDFIEKIIKDGYIISV